MFRMTGSHSELSPWHQSALCNVFFLQAYGLYDPQLDTVQIILYYKSAAKIF